jgi:hypothetical protein
MRWVKLASEEEYISWLEYNRLDPAGKLLIRQIIHESVPHESDGSMSRLAGEPVPVAQETDPLDAPLKRALAPVWPWAARSTVQ